MGKKTNPEFSERHCSLEDLEKAKRKKRILRPRYGKNAIEVMREYMAAKKIGSKPGSTVTLLGIPGMLDIDGISNIVRGRAIRKPVQEKPRLVAAAAKVAR